MARANFPFVSSNVRRANGQFLGGNQYLIKEFDGFRVGIFGISTLRTLEISSPGLGLNFINEIDAAREVVNILRNRERVDVVIGLTHMGIVQESANHITSQRLASAVPGIDIIVDGHSHSFMEAPLRVGSTYIVQANEWGRYIGQARLQIQGGRLIGFTWSPVPVRPDTAIATLLRPYIERADASLKEVIGNATDLFIFGNRLPRYQETALGNAICDANVEYFRRFGHDVDFAFHNGGNIRAELARGPITRESVLTILPFENLLYIVSLTGAELIELGQFIATIPQGAGGFPQFSSDVRLTLDVPNRQITSVTIGGNPIDPNRTYRFITNDFLLGGGDGYTILTRARDRFDTSLLLSDVVMEVIQYVGTISPYLDGRMAIIGGATGM
jgi:5'-nucleotidase/UDP-sugar diphosphatase